MTHQVNAQQTVLVAVYRKDNELIRPLGVFEDCKQSLDAIKERLGFFIDIEYEDLPDCGSYANLMPDGDTDCIIDIYRTQVTSFSTSKNRLYKDNRGRTVTCDRCSKLIERYNVCFLGQKTFCCQACLQRNDAS